MWNFVSFTLMWFFSCYFKWRTPFRYLIIKNRKNKIFKTSESYEFGMWLQVEVTFDLFQQEINIRRFEWDKVCAQHQELGHWLCEPDRHQLQQEQNEIRADTRTGPRPDHLQWRLASAQVHVESKSPVELSGQVVLQWYRGHQCGHHQASQQHVCRTEHLECGLEHRHGPLQVHSHRCGHNGHCRRQTDLRQHNQSRRKKQTERCEILWKDRNQNV